MRIEIEIEVDKDGDVAEEVDEIRAMLTKLQGKLEWYSGAPEDGKILDYNGNSVGKWSVQ